MSPKKRQPDVCKTRSTIPRRNPANKTQRYLEPIEHIRVTDAEDPRKLLYSGPDRRRRVRAGYDRRSRSGTPAHRGATLGVEAAE